MGQAGSAKPTETGLHSASAETQSLRSPPAAGDGSPDGCYDPELATHGGACERKFAVGQVTVRLPLEWQPLPLLALALSFLPWLMPVFLLADFCCTRRWASLALLLMLACCSALSELVMKPICRQPRPPTSACRRADGELTHGMPSGHVLTSQAFLTCLVLYVCIEVPVSEAAWVLPVLAIFMGGVPWARVYNGDHTMMQVLVAAVCGTCCGAIAYALYHCCAPDAWHAAHRTASAPARNESLLAFEPARPLSVH